MLLFVVIGAVIVGLWARSAFSEKRKREREQAPPRTKDDRETGSKTDDPSDAPTELNKHPERLDQMLDPTDDA
jgi:hypothetical protein